MKKTITFMLCLIMTAALLGCSSAPADTTTTAPAVSGFSAGFAREVVTPSNTDLPIIDKQYLCGVAIADAEGNTAIMITCDTKNANAKAVSPIRSAVSEKTGVPVENIQFSITHTHSSDIVLNSDTKTAAVNAAAAAIESLAPASIYYGSVETESMNFVRHYKMGDGTIAGDNFGDLGASEKLDQTCEADHEMLLIRIVREGYKDVLIIGWQAHPTLASHLDSQSADYIAPLRTAVEDALDCDFMFIQGAAGNVNPRSRIEAENVVEKNHVEYAEKLAKFAATGMESLTEVTYGPVAVKTMTYTGNVRKDDAETVAAIPIFESVFAETGSRVKACAATGGLLNSKYAVSGIAKRASAGDTKDLDISAISMGSISFVVVPYEMFTENGQFIKENSPFDMTLIIGYANSSNSYIPSQQAFDYGCYEKDTGYFTPGTGEELADTYISMLKELKGE